MGNTVPPRASRETTGSGGRRRSEDVVVTDVEKEGTTARAGRPRAGGALRAGGGDGTAPAGKVLTVKIVMTRKDAEALVARVKAQSARERMARMAELKGALRAGNCGGGGGGGASRDARRSMLPPIKENRF